MVLAPHEGPKISEDKTLTMIKFSVERVFRVEALSRWKVGSEMMADEFNFLRPEIRNYKAEADADLIPIPGQLELHGRCRCGVLLSTCFCALFVADLIVGMEELEVHCRYNFRKKIATISVRMV